MRHQLVGSIDGIDNRPLLNVVCSNVWDGLILPANLRFKTSHNILESTTVREHRHPLIFDLFQVTKMDDNLLSLHNTSNRCRGIYPFSYSKTYQLMIYNLISYNSVLVVLLSRG